MSRLRRIIVILCGAMTISTCSGGGSNRAVPNGYPASYATQIAEADREGELEIWSSIDQQKTAGLMADFHRLYPKLRVHYVEFPARALYQRFLDQTTNRHGTVDFLWSSAMDLMIKLVNDGYAQRYVSPERGGLPRWANWKNQAWGTTAEPIVFLYNRRLVADSTMPRDHEALLRLLERRPPDLRGRIATYDIRSSAVGYLYLSQDAEAEQDVWRFIRAMAANDARFYGNAEQMVQAVADGHLAIGYNVVGSYALAQAEKHPDIGMVVPRDYSLLMSRIAIIPAAARHPKAAGLFLDFLLSRRGQAHLVAEDIPPIRRDVTGPPRLAAAGTPLRAIRVGPALLISQDRLTRQYVLRRWQAALTEGQLPQS